MAKVKYKDIEIILDRLHSQDIEGFKFDNTCKVVRHNA